MVPFPSIDVVDDAVLLVVVVVVVVVVVRSVDVKRSYYSDDDSFVLVVKYWKNSFDSLLLYYDSFPWMFVEGCPIDWHIDSYDVVVMVVVVVVHSYCSIALDALPSSLLL